MCTFSFRAGTESWRQLRARTKRALDAEAGARGQSRQRHGQQQLELARQRGGVALGALAPGQHAARQRQVGAARERGGGAHGLRGACRRARQARMLQVGLCGVDLGKRQALLDVRDA
jgi:hypothetical protein